MAYDPSTDPEFAAALGRIDAADDEDVAQQLAADIGARRKASEHPILNFATNLPKNIGVGVYKAIFNTLDTASDLIAEQNPMGMAAKAVGGEELRKMVSPSLSEQYPEVMGALRTFTDQWERNDTLGDDITQGIAQFTVPFMGYMKLLGGVRAGSAVAQIGKMATAEAVTAGSAFDPHDGRLADLVKLGQESETRFGDVLRTVAPDGSLINSYIDYMTSRNGTTPDERRNGVTESENEGRFKNMVDSLTGSAVIAGVLKGAAVAYKGLRHSMEGLVPSSDGKLIPKQKGSLGVRENVQDQPVKDEFIMPGSTVITVGPEGKPEGFISFMPGGEGLQINRSKVNDASLGQGRGKELLLAAAEYADRAGKPLNSDDTVTVAQLRVYESLAKSGKITFTYSNPEAVKIALANGDPRMPVKGAGKPVVKNIKLVKEQPGA